MPKAILICGKLCSGKTTYAERLRKESKAVLLSVDEIMLELFGYMRGDRHDEYAEKIQKYLFDKSVEIIESGSNVILDWGFWTKGKRTQVKTFYHDRNIACELHYVNISDRVWMRRVARRNRAVQAGETKAYLVDDGLMKNSIVALNRRLKMR